MTDTRAYLEVSPQQGAAFFGSPDNGPVVMLNLLRFRETADYAHAPDRAPPAPVSGREAYELYMRAMLPLLEASGGAVLFSGSAGAFLIGPAGEGWDHVLLVRQASKSSFLAFASDPESQRIAAHRTAAISDSRLLPIRAD
ncbi:DUF1330 domain-containing protein [Porphyrobacter sp. AAP82]|uniref:DUF1330 domain-containing protein n=1 Tax=Porphyrobacter sp. AAP82 TaxID=1248917 RepID=UPI00030D24FC|nr:DUF1330 domain-containing protein [Porphyrobacter sp. AAP82]